MRRDELITARRRAGKNQEKVAEEVGVDRTTVSNWERGERTPQPHQRKLYAESIEITMTQLDGALSNMTDEVRSPVGLAAFLAMEQSATEIAAYEPHVLPGLLQLPRYAAAIARSVGVAASASDVYEQRNVEQRRWRQARLERGEVAVHSVISEMATRLQLGTHTDMADQLDHVVQMAERDNITVQVVPFSVGQHEALRIGGSIFVMTHPFVRGRSVYWAHYPGLSEVDDPDEAANFIAAVEQASALALTPDESLTFLARAADEWRQA